MKENKGIKLTIIKMNDKISNIYVNTGNYAYKVAEEMQSKFGNIIVQELKINLSNSEFLNLLLEYELKK